MIAFARRCIEGLTLPKDTDRFATRSPERTEIVNGQLTLRCGFTPEEIAGAPEVDVIEDEEED